MTITITHTHADGTQLTGYSRDDGVYDIAIKHSGWRWGRSVGLYIQASRDKDAQTWKIDPLVAALRAAEHEVTIDIDNDWRPAAEREAARSDRVDARVERLGDRASSAASRSTAARAAHERIAEGIPFGQPLLVGHHSEGRARRDQDRMHSLGRRQFDEADKTKDLNQRANGAASNEAAKHDPRAIARRLEVLEKEVRDWQRRRDESSNPDYHARCDNDIARLTEDIDHQRGKLAAMAASGEFVAWSPENLQKGDEIRAGYSWYRVTRVNKKSVSLDTNGSWPQTMTWDGIHGRRRDGMQVDKPNGEAWPVELAVKVIRWEMLLHLAARTGSYDTANLIQRANVRIAQRFAVGLSGTASDAELAAFPAPADAAAGRALAAASLDIFDRLVAGERAPDIAATLTPAGIEPAWTMPTGDPTDVRAPLLAPGDIIKGMWQRGYGGRELWPHFAGPVASVSDVSNRRERGDWVTITLVDGTTRDAQTHVWFAVYPASTS